MVFDDYIPIGSSPADETCVQVGTPNYYTEARLECNRFINLIREKLGWEPKGAELMIKTFPHDLGGYLEVVCWFNTDHREAVDYAFMCENKAPVKWES